MHTHVVSKNEICGMRAHTQSTASMFTTIGGIHLQWQSKHRKWKSIACKYGHVREAKFNKFLKDLKIEKIKSFSV